MDATYVECSFYKVQLSPKQSWSVVRSRRLKEGTLSWRRWRHVHASLRVVLIETEGIVAAVEPLRRWYTTGGSIDQHWSNLERDTCIWMAHERKISVWHYTAKFKGVGGHQDSRLASMSAFINEEPLELSISCQNFEFSFVIKWI